MKVLQFPLARITLFFIAGILSAFYLKPDLSSVFLFLGFFSVVFILSFFLSIKKINQKIHFAISTYLLSFLIGATTLVVHNDYFDKENYIHLVAETDREYTIAVTLREKLKTTSYNERYVATVNYIDGIKTNGKILLNIRKDSLKHKLEIGSNLLLKENIYKHKHPYNPDQFDYGKYLENKSILSQVYVDVQEIKINDKITKNLWYYSSKLRNRIIENLEKSNFNNTELNIAVALILGQKQDISPEVMQDYQYAGAVHILSVSGLHVGYILLFLNFLLRRIPKTRVGNLTKLFLIISCLWCFAIIAGLSPSIVRSVTMFSFIAIGMHLRRKTNIFHTLIVSMLLILIFQPSFLFDVGFQLSYFALFFILWLQPILSGFWKPENKVCKYLWDILTVSFSAQIGTFPLSIYYFHQFPGLFFLTNMIILPFLGFIMGLGMVVMIWALFGLVPLIFVKALEYSIFGLNWIINWIASFESFIFRDIPFNIYMEISLYVWIAMSVLWMEKRSFKRLVFVLSAFILFQISLFGTKYHTENQNEMLVFHSRKNSIFVERKGKQLKVFANDSILKNLEQDKNLKSFTVANFIETIKKEKSSNFYYFNQKKIFVIDSSGVYPKNIKPDVVLLIQSPKVNLDRFLLVHKPEIIVADGSNYKTYIERWKATCEKQKIPFHAVGEKGFYRIE
ncbi:competence protein ComEC [Flavobacterium arsenatis]|uniref:Competence protein ComEC n=1 Tax=Flavobacterium arsenatis TaxID=1484332 RepID=A0ABU1TK74_9FLAO|nr:ComEC/Rec2 family competence protein [Flavobacterium arsenatis]MDR6966385.1 competence protein ComEC [Flavobacterium arsenatis]